MIRYETKTIKGRTYGMNTLGALEGLDILPKVLALIGKPIAIVGEQGLKGGGLDLGSLPVEVMASAISALLADAGKADVAQLIQRLLSGLELDKRPVDFNTHFSANYGDLIPLIGWSMEINFSSFFGESPSLQDLASRLGVKAPEGK
jgi:hypothetical protein